MTGNTTAATLGVILSFLVTGAHGAMTTESLDVNVDALRGVVRLTATSTGCTRAEHFRLAKNDDGTVSAVRLKRDMCRRRAFRVSFEYPLEDIPTTSNSDTPTSD